MLTSTQPLSFVGFIPSTSFIVFNKLGYLGRWPGTPGTQHRHPTRGGENAVAISDTPFQRAQRPIFIKTNRNHTQFLHFRRPCSPYLAFRCLSTRPYPFRREHIRRPNFNVQQSTVSKCHRAYLISTELTSSHRHAKSIISKPPRHISKSHRRRQQRLATFRFLPHISRKNTRELYNRHLQRSSIHHATSDRVDNPGTRHRQRLALRVFTNSTNYHRATQASRTLSADFSKTRTIFGFFNVILTAGYTNPTASHKTKSSQKPRPANQVSEATIDNRRWVRARVGAPQQDDMQDLGSLGIYLHGSKVVSMHIASQKQARWGMLRPRFCLRSIGPAPPGLIFLPVSLLAS